MRPLCKIASDLKAQFWPSLCVCLALASLSSHASTFRNLYSFHAPERYPQGGLILAQDGNFYGTTAYGGPYGAGTIFRMTPAGQITPMVAFNGTDGASPQAALVQARDGNFYGTTNAGGQYGQGTIFRMSPTGVLTSLYSFTGGSDGANPNSALVFGSDGNLYGTTMGGAFVIGTVFRISTEGTFTLLNTMGGYPTGLILGRDNNFYGGTYFGGSFGYGSVFQMTPTGTVTEIYSFTGGSDGGFLVAPLTLGQDGEFYGSNVYSNNNYLGTLFKITQNGVLTPLYSFTGGNDGAYVAAPLMQASDGNFYGISSSGGQHANGTIFRITGAGTFTSIYSLPGSGSSGNVPFLPNRGALVQGAGNMLYGIAPQLYNALFEPDDGDVFQITESGQFTLLDSFISPNGEGPAAIFTDRGAYLYGVAALGGIENAGTLFRLTPAQSSLQTLIEFGGASGIAPTGLIEGTDGNLYGVTYKGASGFGAIFRTTRLGQLLWQLNFNGTNGAFPAAGLFEGQDGNFYGTTTGGGEFSNGTIFRVTPQGVLTTLYSFTGAGDGAYPDAPLVEGKGGTLFGTTFDGGASNCGTIFSIAPPGIFTTVYSFTCGSDGGFPSTALTLGDDGNLYGTTFGGGVNFVGNVFQVTPSGAFTILYSFSFEGTDGVYPLSALVKGPGGIFYGSTIVGGTFESGTIFSVTTSGSEMVLYSFTNGIDGNSPDSLIPGPDGAIFGTTSNIKNDVGTIFEFQP